MAEGRQVQRTGVVLSDAMDKSITVGVEWMQRHPIYRKNRRRMTRLMAHDETNDAKLGDRVLLAQARPYSKHKRWRLVQVLERADLAEVQPEEIDPEPAEMAQAESEGEE